MTEIGTGGLIKIASAYYWDPATGQRVVERWKGNKDDVKTTFDTYINSGVRASMEPIEGTPKAILSVDQGGDGVDVDANVQSVWTLIPSVEEQSLFVHPNYKATFEAMSDAGLVQFKKDLRDFSEEGITPSGWPGGLGSPLEDFVRLWCEEIRTFTTTRWVLRHTRVVAPTTSLTADYTNYLRTYTTTALATAESPPSTILSTLPTGSWLKQACAVEQLSDGRFSIVREWWYRETGGWDSRIYSAAV